MNKVILFSTVHRERGKCSSEELKFVLQDVNPDVIFEELSPSYHQACYSNKFPDTLETKAIKLHLKQYDAKNIPVDIEITNITSLNFKYEVDTPLDIFDENLEYTSLGTQRDYLATQIGFRYLNSVQCEVLMRRRKVVEDSIVRNSNSKVHQIYKMWQSVNETREQSMLQNIRMHFTAKTNTKGIFLVGADHRNSILSKIEELQLEGNLNLEWIVNSFD